MEWSIVYYSSKAHEEIACLSKGIHAKYVAVIDRMVVIGPNIGLPHTRPMGKGLFEIRLQDDGNIARVFYCTVKNKKIVMLHSFNKKTQKTPKHELDIAFKRLKEIKDHVDS